MLWTIRYQAATYTGTMSVHAEEQEHAIAKVKAKVRKMVSLPMYYESYKVVGTEEE